MLRRLAQMMLALNIDNNLGYEIMEHVHKPCKTIRFYDQKTIEKKVRF